MASRRSVEATGQEFVGLDVGDKRLNARALSIAVSIGKRPSASLPEAMRSDSALEATYRFLGNERFKPSELLAAHQRCTVERAKRVVGRGGPLVMVHDTTEAKFGGEFQRQGLGLLVNRTQGFFGHVSLLASYEGEVRDPLGVLHVQTIVRAARKPKRRGGDQLAKDGDSEGRRWFEGMKQSEDLVGGPGKVVHVADREADAYSILAQLEERQSRYVIRNQYDRRTFNEDGEIQLLREAVRNNSTLVLARTVKLTARNPGEKNKTSRRGAAVLKGSAYVRTLGSKKTHPARDERLADLHITAGRHILKRPRSETDRWPAQLAVNVVRVFEPEPPEGQEAVEWFLLTNEPIDTKEQVAAVVDAYRTRWVIEEFFKAMKTGCNYEKSQLESFQALLSLFCLLCPIAWRMLRMRALSRTQEDLPATAALSDTQLILLRLAHPKLPKKSTVKEALMAVAALGGHIKNNGPPGWLVIGRGFHELLSQEVGFYAGLQHATK